MIFFTVRGLNGVKLLRVPLGVGCFARYIVISDKVVVRWANSVLKICCDDKVVISECI